MEQNEHEFSELTIQYNMHIEHINHARNQFEQEMKEFIDVTSTKLSRILTDKKVDHPFILARGIDIEEKANTTVNTSFWVDANTYLLGQKKNGKKRTGIGHFNTGVYYEYDLKTFVWYASFKNSNYLSDEIDEICHKNILTSKSLSNIFVKNRLLKNDDVFFFRHPIDMEFKVDVQDALKKAIDVLYSSIEETGLIKLKADVSGEGEFPEQIENDSE